MAKQQTKGEDARCRQAQRRQWQGKAVSLVKSAMRSCQPPLGKLTATLGSPGHPREELGGTTQLGTTSVPRRRCIRVRVTAGTHTSQASGGCPSGHTPVSGAPGSVPRHLSQARRDGPGTVHDNSSSIPSTHYAPGTKVPSVPRALCVIPVMPYEKAAIAIPNLQIQKLRLG